LNGKKYFSDENAVSLPKFAVKVYRHENLSHSKFFKMDGLCKVSFISSALLLKHTHLLEHYSAYDVGVVLSNSASSLSSDTAFYDTIKNKDDFYPSPAVFTYTLPNITIGEICIFHGFKGENAFFVNEKPDFKYIINYVKTMLPEHMKACIIGWVDYYSEAASEYALEAVNKAALFLIEKEPAVSELSPAVELTEDNVLKLYNSNN
jgi:hypothetical protein